MMNRIRAFRVRRLVIVVTCAFMLASCGSDDSVFRTNVGKVAFNATNGVEVGKIVGVSRVNGAWVYEVEREGRIINVPVTNVRIAEGSKASALPETKKLESEPKVGPYLKTTATEFGRRLTQYDGKLESLTFSSNTVTAVWASEKCTMLEGEIIDLLLSVNRTLTSSPAVRATRTCKGDQKTFALSGRDFQRYRTGEINDGDVLKGIK